MLGGKGGEGGEEVAVHEKRPSAFKDCLDFLEHLGSESRLKGFAKSEVGCDFGQESRQVGAEPVLLRDLVEAEVDRVVWYHRWPVV